MPTKEAPLPAGNCLWARAHRPRRWSVRHLRQSEVPPARLWYQPYQSGVEHSLKNHADEAGRVLFLVGAAIMASVAVYAVWRPRSVFDNVRIEHHELPIDDLGR